MRIVCICCMDCVPSHLHLDHLLVLVRPHPRSCPPVAPLRRFAKHTQRPRWLVGQSMLRQPVFLAWSRATLQLAASSPRSYAVPRERAPWHRAALGRLADCIFLSACSNTRMAAPCGAPGWPGDTASPRASAGIPPKTDASPRVSTGTSISSKTDAFACGAAAATHAPAGCGRGSPPSPPSPPSTPGSNCACLRGHPKHLFTGGTQTRVHRWDTPNTCSPVAPAKPPSMAAGAGAGRVAGGANGTQDLGALVFRAGLADEDVLEPCRMGHNTAPRYEVIGAIVLEDGLYLLHGLCGDWGHCA